MKLLIATLSVKIVLTVLIWAVPPLFFPRLLARIGVPALVEPLFGRLLGIAFLALAVMYAFGLSQASRGEIPWAVITVGLVSNGGAAVLIVLAVRQGWLAGPGWSTFGRRVILASGVAASLVFVGLAVSAIDVYSGSHS